MDGLGTMPSEDVSDLLPSNGFCVESEGSERGSSHRYTPLPVELPSPDTCSPASSTEGYEAEEARCFAPDVDMLASKMTQDAAPNSEWSAQPWLSNWYTYTFALLSFACPHPP